MYPLKFLLFASLCTIAFTACFTPRSIIQMDADKKEAVDWNYGHQVVTVKSDSLEMKVFFDEFTKDHLVFDLEITNWRSQPILVSPETLKLETPDGFGLSALDPEAQIFERQVKASRQLAGQKNTAVVLGVATVAAVAVAIAADDDNNDDDGYDGDLVFVSTNVVPPPPLAYLPPDVIFWEDFSLRKTTLQPDFRATGKVVFPRLDRHDALIFIVPIDGVELRAAFTQREFQP